MLGEKADVYRQSIEKGLDYIAGAVNPDGSVNPVQDGSFAYYKLPWALVLGGYPEQASLLIERLVQDTMTPEGDFYTERRGKFHLDYYTYENAWILLASHLLSFFDIARKGWRYIERFRDPNTGGICSKAPYEAEADRQEDALSTAWTCNVGLHLGKVEMAQGAGDFIQMLWDIQPDPENNFYYYWKPKSGLVVERPPEEPEDRYFRINREEPANWYYILGAQIAFICKLYLATGEEKHLSLARRIQEFGMGCHEDIFHTDSAGKFCYGNSYLFYATGEEKYLRVAERCADHLVSDQQPEGYWMRDGKIKSSSTAEFCVWLMNLLAVVDVVRLRGGSGC